MNPSSRLFSARCLRAVLCATAASFALSAQAASGVLFSAGFNAWPQVPQSPINPLTQPEGGVFLGTHFWVADSLNGFYRMDPDPAGVRLPSINVATGNLLTLGKTGQVAYDRVSGWVFVSEPQQPKGNGLGGQGVVAFHFNPAFDRFDIGGCLFVQSTLAGRRPGAVAYGPDGRLYIGFTTSGDIVRVDVSPIVAATSCGELPVQTIGKSQFGGRVASLAFVGGDLYLAGVDGLGVIRNAAACISSCVAQQVPGSAFRTTHPGLAADGLGALYYLLNNQVWRYTPATSRHETYASGGTLPDGSFSSFAFAAGQANLVHVDASGNLWIGDDTSDGKLNGFGRIFFLSAGQPALP